MPDAEDFDVRLDATKPVEVRPKPGTLAYAQAVAEQHGDLEDAAIEDGMDPASADCGHHPEWSSKLGCRHPNCVTSSGGSDA